jgi:tetratricopeptide (TPR) repeat protein
MVGGAIFISYRRDDTAGEAGRLADHLTQRFGSGRVFIDIDTIAPGAKFADELERALAGTTVVLAIIGRHWLTATDARGTRRLDDPDDFVRREILTALQRGSRVIPVLVQDARVPTAAELPEMLAPLADRQAMAIQHEEFAADAQRLADAIAPSVDPERDGSRLTRASLSIAAFALVLAAGVGSWQWQRSRAAAEDAVRAAEQTDTAGRARQQQVDDLVQVAVAQHERRQFSDALSTLERAASLDADVSRATALQEDVAMEWIRELSVPDGQRFADAMTQPLAVLDRAAPFAAGPRQGDLLAHLGWATFLRSRNGESGDPVAAYRKALAVDAANPYANAMLGHYLLSHQGGARRLEEARRLFRVATDAGRATDEVRGFQLAAFRNASGADVELETIRAIDEMRRRGETLRPREVSDAWAIYYFAFRDDQMTRALLSVLPPSDHLKTLQWGFEQYVQGDESRAYQLRYYMARLQAEAGDTTAARTALQTLRTELGPGNTMRNTVDAALKALTPPRR